MCNIFHRGMAIACGLALCIAHVQAQEYEIGGPLAGLRLPLYKTQHGEPAGHPGCMPELAAAAKARDPRNDEFTAQGQYPELELYPGSLEHWRAYWQHYMPIRSFFDRQSLIRKFVAPALPGADKAQVEEYAEPVYWVGRFGEPKFTGRVNQPVPVIRCKVNAPVFAIECGVLPVGLYAVRVIGAVETASLIQHRKPLIFRMTVNDGLRGEENSYRFRAKYVDEFYAMAEFYFHAPEQREYHATVAVDEDSRVEPLVQSIDVHDALAGATRRALKQRSGAWGSQTPPSAPAASEDRLARDTMLWGAMPDVNAQFGLTYGSGGDNRKTYQPNEGAGGLSPAAINEQWGEWKLAPLSETLIENKKLNLRYTMRDLGAGRPLPAPYPFKDRGAGVWTPPAREGENPQNWYPVANAVNERVRRYVATIKDEARKYREKGDAAAGRDAALMLVRFAYQYPAIDSANYLECVLLNPGPYGRDMGCRRRTPRNFLIDPDFLDNYDILFDIVKNDPTLATAVRQFVPWVKSSDDLVQLVDVYLVQTVAKRLLRYHIYFANEPTLILTPAVILGGSSVTDPWVEWLFTRAFVYPLPLSGFQDLLVTAYDRDGIGYIGSYGYTFASGEHVGAKAEMLERYLDAGGNPKYDFRDPKRNPKPIASGHWFLESRMAGLYFPRIGDVTGPDKNYAAWFSMGELGAQCRRAWKWTKDAKFAFVLKHYFGRAEESESDWADIETAAARQKRAPWLENRSRVIPNWFGALETGIEHDDFRFRRAAMLRIGQGTGHAHADTLDLQIHAHGYPMTIDGGQRGGYSTPNDANTRVHNLVRVDEKNWQGHAWITALTDAEGARYMAAEAVPLADLPDVKLYRRQVALLDVDEGRGSMPLDPQGMGPNPTLDPDVVTPNSYVFDVVRVAGGKSHTYCFHGMLEDELVSNVPGVDRTPTPAPVAAPDVIEATWRMSRGPNMEGGRALGDERGMAPSIWNEKSPRKYTRLHLFDQKGASVSTSPLTCNYLKYMFTSLYANKRTAENSEVLFPAIIEPYVGEPFIVKRSLLPVADNDNDARKAVAVEVVTTNGHHDVCFADGRPEKLREVGKLRISGEFAYYSTDNQGLRLATLTGGTLLSTPDLTLKPALRERSGRITEADYLEKTFLVDQPWPGAALLTNRVCEIGVPEHMTTYTIDTAAAQGKTTRIRVKSGADFYQSRVVEVDPTNRIVYCVLSMPVGGPGLEKHWVASNGAVGKDAKHWRAECLGRMDDKKGCTAFKLDGPVTEGSFGETGAFRLWEYGVGDTARQSTFAAVRRIAPGAYELTCDVDVEVTLAGGKPRTVTVDELARAGGAVRLTE